jgi:hypothetical protein
VAAGSPFEPADNPNITTVTIHHIMYLPILILALTAENGLIACTPLINWLWVASTGSVNQGAPACEIMLTAPLANQDLLNHRSVLQRQPH